MLAPAGHPEGVFAPQPRWWASTTRLRLRNARMNIDRAMVILGLLGAERVPHCPHCGPQPRHIKVHHGSRKSWLWCLRCRRQWTPIELLGLFGYTPAEAVDALH